MRMSDGMNVHENSILLARHTRKHNSLQGVMLCTDVEKKSCETHNMKNIPICEGEGRKTVLAHY